jgi:biopolymer transport protein ExbD
MMRIPSEPRRERNEWVLQFINIIFLILLFFLVNATIQSPPPQNITPPVSIMSEVSAPPSGALFIDRNGAIFWENRQINLQELGAAELRPHALYADKALQARKLVAAISALRTIGIQGLPLITVRAAP